MADITKCANQTCQITNCYRKTAPDNEFWQSYSYFGDEGCLFCDNYIQENKSEE